MISASVGIFMVEWIEHFQKGKGTTSWISTANQSLVYFAGKFRVHNALLLVNYTKLFILIACLCDK